MSATNILLIYNARLVDAAIDTPGAVLVVGDKIRAVYTGYFTSKKTLTALVEEVLHEDGLAGPNGEFAVHFHDARGLVLMPAFIDMHTHIRYPGQTAKEDLLSGLSAAVAGGYGTIVAMPNTSPVVSDAALALAIEDDAAKLRLANLLQAVSITRGFDGADTSHLKNIPVDKVPLISEDGHDVSSSKAMFEAMCVASSLGLVVSCHSEDENLSALAKPLRQKALTLMKQYHLNSWGGVSSEEDDEALDAVPDEVFDEIENSLTEANDILAVSENIATMRNLELAKLAGCHVHIAHVSTKNAIDAVRRAKQEINDRKNEVSEFETLASYDAFEAYGEYNAALLMENDERFDESTAEMSVVYDFIEKFNVTCEVTPHHIALIGTDGKNLRAIVNPPLRSDDDMLALVEALRDGTVDVISTDHAPHTLSDKENGSPGFVGLETAFAVCHSVLVAGSQITLQKLSELMSKNPALILHLNKGEIAIGKDADFTLIDTAEEWTVDSDFFKSKGRATPFEGATLTGRVKETFVGGRLVYGE